jgi:hypothetical protein
VEATKKRKTRAWIPAAVVLAMIALAFAIVRPDIEKITPWVEYQQSAPLIDAPHLLMIGSYKSKVRVKRGLLWHTVYEGDGHSSGAAWNKPVAFDGGHAILLDAYPDLMVFREGAQFPAYLPREDCLLRYWSPDRRAVVCMTFGYSKVGTRSHIASVQLDFHDSTGKVVGRVSGVVPPELDGHFNYLRINDPVLLGYDSAGFPVLGTPKYADPVVRDLCAAVAIGPSGMREVERKVMSSDSLCPRRAKDWAVIRNGGIPADR